MPRGGNQAIEQEISAYKSKNKKPKGATVRFKVNEKEQKKDSAGRKKEAEFFDDREP